MKVTGQIYKQFLLNSQINYTCDYLSKFSDFSGDSIERYLKLNKLSPSFIWEQAKSVLVQSKQGYLIIDDTVLEHESGSKIECAYKQWSGNKHKLIYGIGVINLVYYNPEIDEFWVIDNRVYDPDRDSKTKNQHAQEMLISATYNKCLTYQKVLFDSIYASKELLLLIGEDLKKIYVTNLPSNRICTDNNGTFQILDLEWTQKELEKGKTVLLNHFPKKHLSKLYQLARTESRIDNLCTNDLSTETYIEIQEENSKRWKVEQLHRETKQLTGINKCQCRKQRSQRNHIILANLIWFELKKMAKKFNVTIYQAKKGLLDNYMFESMKHPVWVVC
jgi:hypothetical protein